MVGDGELREQLVACRNRLGLGKHVLLPGPKSYRELPAYYGLAGAFIHASTVEQWGLVVNEAMAAGLPVLVSNRCGCAADLIVPGVNGFLFDPYDVGELAGLMREVSKRSFSRQAFAEAGQQIVARWSPERFAEGLALAVETACHAILPMPDAVDRLLVWMLRHR
jgi:glycosyltransferase involved in cell wall biosynthesis